MSINYESDTTYCSIFESTNKRFSKVNRKSNSVILDDIYKKIENHIDGKQLLNAIDAIKYKKQISSMKIKSYKLKFRAGKIKTYLNGIYKQSKSFEETKLPEMLSNKGDLFWDCGITQDLIAVKDYRNDFNPVALPVQTDNQSLLLNTDMLSNQLFIRDYSQYDHSQNCEMNFVSKETQNSDVLQGVSYTDVNLNDNSQNCELNIVTKNTYKNSDVSCTGTETLQKAHDKSVYNQSLVNITDSNESTISISENVSIKELNKTIGLIPTNCASASFKTGLLTNQNFLKSTKSFEEKCIHHTNTNDKLTFASQDFFTQQEVNKKATNSTELLEFNWSPTRVINETNTLSFNSCSNELGEKREYNKQLFNIVKKPTFKFSQHLTKNETDRISTSLMGPMSIAETETMSFAESLRCINTESSGYCDKMDIEINPSSVSEYCIKNTDSSPEEIFFKKPVMINRKLILADKTQVPASLTNNSDLKYSDLKKSDINIIGNVALSNECEELCNLTKKFLCIAEATNDDTKKTIEILKNLSNHSPEKEIQTVSEIGILCTELFNKKINNLFYNIGSGSENWDKAAETLDETSYLHQEISDWLQDILDNIGIEDKTKTKKEFNSLENQVANCLHPNNILVLEITSLFHSNYIRLKQISSEFNRKLISESFELTTRNEERINKSLSHFDWKKLL